jgi:nicotinamidase-related amidase
MTIPHPMTLPRGNYPLIVTQERPFRPWTPITAKVIRNIKILAATAGGCACPWWRRAVPQGPGTLTELRDTLGPEVQPVPKVSFSCWAAEEVRARLRAAGTRRVILAGIEAHVCVLISALELMSEGLAVHVPADAVTSRTQGNWRLGTEQLRQAGAVVTATETIVFQLLGQADTDDFRELARLVR